MMKRLPEIFAMDHGDDIIGAINSGRFHGAPHRPAEDRLSDAPYSGWKRDHEEPHRQHG